MNSYPGNVYPAYHAHVYFDAGSVARAKRLCEAAGRELGVTVGRVHEKLVGPHPRWSCQLAFDAGQFEKVIPWLDRHRADLTVFVHGLTGDDLADHTTHAAWLGEPQVLNLEVFRKKD